MFVKCRRWSNFFVAVVATVAIIGFIGSTIQIYHISAPPRQRFPIESDIPPPSVDEPFQPHNCSKTVALSDDRIADKTTLIIQTYEGRINSFLSVVWRLHTFCDTLAAIIVVWNSGANRNLTNAIQRKLSEINETNNCYTICNTESQFGSKPPLIHFYPQNQNLVTNRYYVTRYHRFTTQTAMFIDDDRFLHQLEIHNFIHEWIESSTNDPLCTPVITHPNSRRRFVPLSTNEASKLKDELLSHKQLNVTTVRLNFDMKWKFVWSQVPTYSVAIGSYGQLLSTHILERVPNVMDSFQMPRLVQSQPAKCDDFAFAFAMGYLYRRPFFYIISTPKSDIKNLTERKIQISPNLTLGYGWDSTAVGGLKKKGISDEFAGFRQQLRTHCVNDLLSKLDPTLGNQSQPFFYANKNIAHSLVNGTFDKYCVSPPLPTTDD